MGNNTLLSCLSYDYLAHETTLPGSSGRQGVPQQTDRVLHGASGAVFDLVTATGAAGGDVFVDGGVPDAGQQREFRHRHRGFVMFRLITEGTRHAAAA